MKSSEIKSIGYDNESKVLELEFKSGAVYQYANVAENIYKELISADSIGGYFNRYIRDSHQGYKMDY